MRYRPNWDGLTEIHLDPEYATMEEDIEEVKEEPVMERRRANTIDAGRYVLLKKTDIIFAMGGFACFLVIVALLLITSPDTRVQLMGWVGMTAGAFLGWLTYAASKPKRRRSRR